MKKFIGYAQMLSLIAAIVLFAAKSPASADEITLTTIMPPTITPTGSIVMWAGSGAAADIPAGWMLCNGQAISRSLYASLFAAIGTTYGAGDGATFNLPNFNNRFPIGATASYPLGTAGGATSHTHSLANHTHMVEGRTVSGNWIGTRRDVQFGGSANLPEEDDSSWGISIRSGGGSGNADWSTHMPPYRAAYFIIKL